MWALAVALLLCALLACAEHAPATRSAVHKREAKGSDSSTGHVLSFARSRRGGARAANFHPLKATARVEEFFEKAPSQYTASDRVPDEYIVQLHDFQTHEAAEAVITNLLGYASHAFSFVPRQNAAKAYPTDFVVIRLTNDDARIVERLRSAPDVVRRVFPHRKLVAAPRHGVDANRSAGSGSSVRNGSSAAASAAAVGRLHSAESTLRKRTLLAHSKQQHKSSEVRSSSSSGGGAASTNAPLPPSPPPPPLFHATSSMGAESLWSSPRHRGRNVRVAVFDTGLRADHPAFAKRGGGAELEVTNWTDEDELDDQVGHGTFVASVIGGTEARCPGFAPEASLHIFRVFTSTRVSYTSWFLDAFNYAIHARIDVLNLSIGGPDFLDAPFVDKVLELSANRVTVVSAVGNDGPLYGTLNNPADQADTIGVGGMDAKGRVASFSSRGMTTWQLPTGYGRVKPDVIAYGKNVAGARTNGGCRSLSGTSVSSPVVTGVVALLIGSVDAAMANASALTATAGSAAAAAAAAAAHVSAQAEEAGHSSGGSDNSDSGSSSSSELGADDGKAMGSGSALRLVDISPASVKQVLVEGAQRVPEANIFEQGAGRVDLAASLRLIEAYEPRASLFPAAADLTQCPYFWPYCSQPLYADAQPVLLNVTILNGLGVAGELVGEPHFVAGRNGHVLRVSLSASDVLWPWSGWLGVALRVSPEVNTDAAFAHGALAEGVVRLRVRSAPGFGELEPREQALELPLRVRVVRTPPRARRLLWDQYHSLRYPSGYFPRDNLADHGEPFDWNADHVHTNYRGLYMHLRRAGYFVEVLGEPWTCFDAARYGALLVVDPEEEYFAGEVDKLYADVMARGLSLVVVADWYNEDVMAKIKFFDENTKKWWTPATGGCNVPALNTVLQRFGAALGDRVYSGALRVGTRQARFASGAAVSAWPASGYVLHGVLDDEGLELLTGEKMRVKAPVVGIATARVLRAHANLNRTQPLPEPSSSGSNSGSGGGGALALLGDSSCLDDAASDAGAACYWLLDALLEVTNHGANVDAVLPTAVRLRQRFVSHVLALPQRAESSAADMAQHSAVLAANGELPACAAPHFAAPRSGAGTVAELHLDWDTLLPPLRASTPEGDFPGTPPSNAAIGAHSSAAAAVAEAAAAAASGAAHADTMGDAAAALADDTSHRGRVRQVSGSAVPSSALLSSSDVARYTLSGGIFLALFVSYYYYSSRTAQKKLYERYNV